MGRRDQKIKYVVGVAALAAIGLGVAVLMHYSTEAELGSVMNNGIEVQAPVNLGPATPRTILAGHMTKLPELEAWAEGWEKTHTDKQDGPETSDEDAAKLQTLIEKSDLSAMECMQVADLIGHKDLPALEAWMHAGVPRVVAQIGNNSPDDTSVNPLLDTMGHAMPPLWDDGPKNAVILEQMATLGMRFDRTAPWSQRIEWSRIGHAEALHLQGRYDESLKEADQMVADMAAPGNQFRPEQKAGVHWIRALVLHSLKKDDEAIPDLKQAYAVKTFHHMADAGAMLVIVLAKQHRFDEAKAIRDELSEQHLVSILDDEAQSTLDMEVTLNSLAERDRKAKELEQRKE